jgi:hypothetical protein
MGILDTLVEALEDQFDLGENKNRSLDVIEGGQTKRYAKLGDFANKFDQSAERNYLEEGYLRKDLFNVDPKQREILTQESNITVLVKKRMFSSLAENFDPTYMDKEEKIFYKASRILFDNKCRQIAAYEKLCKIERVTSAVGEIDTALLPIIISLFDELFSLPSSISTDSLFSRVETKGRNDLNKLSSAIDQIKKAYIFSSNRQYTSWLKDDKKLFTSQLGEGTGVIELTNINRLRTTTTISSNGGTCDFVIYDPYELMVITEMDIEKALSDATSIANNHLIFRMGKESIDNIIARNTKLLNDIRRARGASDITFRVNPDTFFSRRVVAIVDALGEEINFTYDAALGLGVLGIGNGVQIDPSCLRGGALLGEQGLDPNNKRNDNLNSEDNLFKDIIVNIFNKLQLDLGTKTVNRNRAEELNYPRRKLRFNFLGKLIIQPMDQVHIYIGSKSMFDNKVLSGFQNSLTGLGFLQNANNMLYDIKNTAYSLLNPSGNIDFEMEKSIILGPNFPSYLWGVLRNQFINDRGGSHVFGGIITEASSNYSDGNFNVNISGADNLKYLEFGFVNFKPSSDVWNGAIYDPLTPFKTRFDAVSSNFKNQAPELLQENQVYLSKNIGLFRHKAGPLAGQIATDKNYISDVIIDQKKVKRRVMYMPDGLVYKWKEGIGTFVQFGDSFSTNDPNKNLSGPAIAPPLAGQDVMNSISLLITGTPYNYATFYKAAKDSGNMVGDPQNKQSVANSFFTSFRNELIKRNMTWGNFIPFKNLVVDEGQLSKVLNGQLSILQKTSNIDDLLIQYQDLLSDKFKITQYKKLDEKLGVEKVLNESENEINNKLLKIRQEIESNLEAIKLEDSTNLRLVGNDVSFDYDDFLNDSKSKSNANVFKPELRRKLRRKINFLTRRLSWQVRANEDRNLMIVDDTYDKDYDIIAFEKDLNNSIELFNSEFTDVKQKVFATAQLLNLEVFCDTQGHIRVRPPQYNKMPSSIFYRMMQMKEMSGIQLFPDFVKDLFTNQLQGTLQRIEALEDLIRLDVIILGQGSDDESIENYLNSVVENGGGFSFFSNQNGIITDINKIINEDLFKNQLAQSIHNKDFFSVKTRYDKTISLLAPDNDEDIGFRQTSINDANMELINKTVDRIQKKTGQKVNIDGFFITNNIGTIEGTLKTFKRPDFVKTNIDLADKIGERQKLALILNYLLKNYKEIIGGNSNKKLSSQIVLPGVFTKNSNIPEFFENMIEDESYDDLGFGSGSRYIIKNSKIISYGLSENKPEHTSITVTGLLEPNSFKINLPQELNTFGGDGGNALVTAQAVDYDMWRMYGMHTTHSIKAPFLSNPETQIAPYAASVLSRFRKNIIRGRVTIVGNEYMQPGEVIYLEPRGMLFYVESVTHNFTYDTEFSTSLELSYGHTPGEYIPTAFDIIGKMIYHNRDTAQLINYRHANTANEEEIGCIIINNKLNTLDPDELIFNEKYKKQNEQVIKNILYTSLFRLNSYASRSSNIRAVIEIRVYHDGSGNLDTKLIFSANRLRNILINPSSVEHSKDLKKMQGFLEKDSKSNSIVKPVVQISIKDDPEGRSPSRRAKDAARNIVQEMQTRNSPNNQSIDLFANAIYTSIIDCYIKFENIQPDKEGKSS